MSSLLSSVAGFTLINGVCSVPVTCATNEYRDSSRNRCVRCAELDPAAATCTESGGVTSWCVLLSYTFCILESWSDLQPSHSANGLLRVAGKCVAGIAGYSLYQVTLDFIGPDLDVFNLLPYGNPFSDCIAAAVALPTGIINYNALNGPSRQCLTVRKFPTTEIIAIDPTLIGFGKLPANLLANFPGGYYLTLLKVGQ